MLFASAVVERSNIPNAPKEALRLKMPAAPCSAAGSQFPTGKEWGLLTTMTFAPLLCFKSG